MKFPNAQNGVKKIFTAEILGLIAAVITLIAAFMGIATVAASSAANSSDAALVSTVAAGAGTVIFFAAAAIIGLIAFILNLIGIIGASKDEAAFKIALYATIAGIVLSVLSGFFTSNPTVTNIIKVLTTVAQLCFTVYVIQGIRNLAVKLGDSAMDEKGNNIFKVILVVLLLQLLASIIVTIFGGQFASVIAAVIFLIGVVLDIVQYILYISFLSKAKKMLAE